MASTDSPSRTADRYAELEELTAARQRARMRRQPLILIGLLEVLVVAVGVVASIDLRRLQTPQGVALRWTEAATFGDCDDYLHFSTGADDRTRDDICRVLRGMTEDARQHNLQIRLAVTSVATHGSSSVVTLDVGPTQDPRHAVLHLRKQGGRWLVVRDAGTCTVVLCA